MRDCVSMKGETLVRIQSGPPQDSGHVAAPSTSRFRSLVVGVRQVARIVLVPLLLRPHRISHSQPELGSSRLSKFAKGLGPDVKVRLQCRETSVVRPA